MRGTRGVLHNLGILGVGQVAAQLLNVWALVFLAGYLGKHWFGVVQIGVAFMSYALITAEWGLMSLGIREISRLDESPAIFRYACTHTGLMLIQALGVFGLGILILPLLPFSKQDPVIFLLYLFAVLPQVFMQSWIAVGLERMFWVGVTKTARSLLYALAILLVLPHVFPEGTRGAARGAPLFFLGTMLLGNLVIMIPVASWFGKPVLPKLPSRSEIAHRWREARPIGANVVVLRVLLNIDLILLGIIATPEMAGTYAAAARIIFLLVIAVEVLWAALLPRLSRLWRDRKAAFARSLNLYLGFVLILLLPIAAGGVLVGGDLIYLLYKGDYPGSAPVFRILAVSYTMLAVGTFLGNSLLAQDKQAHYFRPLLTSAATAIIGNLVLVPRLGPVGAAWGMFAAHGVLLIQLLAINRHMFRRPLFTMLLQILPAILAMDLVISRFGNFNVVARIALGAAVYLTLATYPALRFRSRMELIPDPEAMGVNS